MIRAFLVDDEPLAVRRLARMVTETGRATVLGTSNDPVDAIAWLSSNQVDVVFLDINMPGMNGFEMVRMLDPQPTIVFTTAYDHFALEAFKVNSLDYLLKPIDQEQLDRALTKIERIGIPTGRPGGSRETSGSRAFRKCSAALSRENRLEARRPYSVYRSPAGYSFLCRRQTDIRGREREELHRGSHGVRS